MKNHRTDYHRNIPALAALFLFAIILTFLPVCADDIPTSVIGRYDAWEVEDAATVGMGLFPSVELEPDTDSDTSSSSRLAPVNSDKLWVTISPFIATLSGQETKMIVGYLSGERAGATLTIAGRGGSDSDYADITTIKPDENGLFAWAVPESQSDRDLFRVVVGTGSSQVLSNAIRFTAADENLVDEPVIKPVVSPVKATSPVVTRVPSTTVISPVETEIPESMGDSSGFGLSRLTISASSTSPAVGDDVTISGRLTDQNGKGISGATVSIDESGYPGAAQAEPFDSTQTGSDGRFDFTIQVSFADTVGLVANYEGDESHSSAESNTITFSSHA